MLLRAVVEIPLQPAARLVGRLHDPRTRGTELGLGALVRDRLCGEIGEAAEPDLGAGRERVLGGSCGGERTEQPSRGDHRRGDHRYRPLLRRGLDSVTGGPPSRARRVSGRADPGDRATAPGQACSLLRPTPRPRPPRLAPPPSGRGSRSPPRTASRLPRSRRQEPRPAGARRQPASRSGARMTAPPRAPRSRCALPH